MEKRNLFLMVGLIFWAVLFAGCSFDDSKLNKKTCESDDDCGIGEVCIPIPDDGGGQCSPRTIIEDMGIACEEGLTLCGSECVDTRADPEHCGGCGLGCFAKEGGNQTATCSLSQCLRQCDKGWDSCENANPLCDGDPETCELAVGTMDHCRTLNDQCHESEQCENQSQGDVHLFSCQCVQPVKNCNRDNSDGCEADLNTSPDNCGSCGSVCESGETCIGSQCTCTPGESCTDECCAILDAAGDFVPVCVDTKSNPNHCGACGTKCPAGFSCVGGQCMCGTTTESCAAGEVCCQQQGQLPVCLEATACLCGPQMDVCGGNQVCCSESCTDSDSFLTDSENCGGCGFDCNPGTQMGSRMRECSGGSCRCPAGYGNCDGDLTNGCETDLSSSIGHCGACGSACAAANATGSCSMGTCELECNAGFADCDLGIGCEANTQTDFNNCGGCGISCTGQELCVDGSCSLECPMGTDNCNGSPMDGCEAVLAEDPNNCGACGDSCELYEACSGGSCVHLCTVIANDPAVHCDSEQYAYALCPTECPWTGELGDGQCWLPTESGTADCPPTCGDGDCDANSNPPEAQGGSCPYVEEFNVGDCLPQAFCNKPVSLTLDPSENCENCPQDVERALGSGACP